MQEIRAVQLIAAIERNDLTNCSNLIKSIIKSSIKSFPYGWSEKPYGLDDLDHGSYGAITSAICSDHFFALFPRTPVFLVFLVFCRTSHLIYLEVDISIDTNRILT